MIKKVIHYSWFSGEEFPEQVKVCINSWHKYLPDYEFKLWDLKAVQSIDSVFLKESLSVKKWAFAADYTRLYALYHEGGIWLDTDVELLGSFDEFLDNKCFVGKERFYNLPTYVNFGLCRYLTSHCFGAEAGHPYIKRCLDFYEGRHFIESDNVTLPNDLRFNMMLMPYVMARIAYECGYNWKPKYQEVQYLSEGLTIYPTSFFDGDGGKNCIAIHHHMGGWYDINGGSNKKVSRSRIKSELFRMVVRFLYKCGFVIYRL